MSNQDEFAASEPGQGAEYLADRVFDLVKTLITEVPTSHEIEQAKPELRARILLKGAAMRAATISGTLALPPGPLGLLTVLPDLIGIWRLQARLVSDIAAVYGEEANLTRETLLYCLFRHAAAQAIRDLVTRVGERMVVQRVSWRVSENVLKRAGISIAEHLTRWGVARFLPVIGALGVAGYAYYDTAQVGHTAIELFSKEIEIL